jgi:hypothetical protein
MSTARRTRSMMAVAGARAPVLEIELDRADHVLREVRRRARLDRADGPGVDDADSGHAEQAIFDLADEGVGLPDRVVALGFDLDLDNWGSTWGKKSMPRPQAA